MSDEAENRQLVAAIVEFLRNELDNRNDLTSEDRDSLGIAIECLEIAYGLESQDPRDRRVRRPLLDMFNQVIHPPTVKERMQAERLKTEGNEKMAEHHYEEAVESYTQAIELDKWNAIYYCNRAGANISLHHYYDAVEDCREALALNPDYAKAFARMGQAYAMMERPRQAVRCFQQAVQLEPENERYRNNLIIAENQANTVPPRADVFRSVLNSLFGPTNQQPSGSTLTIISEIAPTNSDSSTGETYSSNEAVLSDLSDETQTEPGTQPNDSQTPNVLQFALPLMLGLLGHLSGHPNDEGENSERMSIELSGETEPETFHFSCPSPIETNENNASLQETSNFNLNSRYGFDAFFQPNNSSENSLRQTENKIESAEASGFSFRQPEPTETHASNRLENTEANLEDSHNKISSDAVEVTNGNDSRLTNLEEQTHSSTPIQKNDMDT